MPTHRLETTLPRTTAEPNGVLLPYLTAGFPDAGVTEGLIRKADELGVACIELGIPFSDSIADGPVIQNSFHSVLESGWRLDDTFALAARIRSSVQCGLAAMVSFSLVHRVGLERFMDRASASGFDGIILPDVPVEESSATKQAADRADLCYIGLVAPTTSAERRETIARGSTGFVYQMAVAGTTGERTDLPRNLAAEVNVLRALSGLPVCVGFGISTAQHVRDVCGIADGAIVGSAIVRRIADGVRHGLAGEALIESVSAFIAELMSGARPRLR